jgi:prepilin-type N-terminal cleavage/methylation domain-containing protein
MIYNYSMKFKKGFTLVELLIVIAIIGILSSVVLASLNAARSKGQDAKVKSQIDGARDSASIFYDENVSYNGLAGDVENSCATADSMFVDVSSGMSAFTDLSNYPSLTTIRCSSTDSTYMISASLSTPGEFWCVDSQSVSKQISAVDHLSAHPDDDTSCD